MIIFLSGSVKFMEIIDETTEKQQKNNGFVSVRLLVLSTYVRNFVLLLTRRAIRDNLCVLRLSFFSLSF